jgi:hypothetical protein
VIYIVSAVWLVQRRNSSLPFRRGPNLSIYHIPSALFIPETSATFINLRPLHRLVPSTSATFINLRPLRRLVPGTSATFIPAKRYKISLARLESHDQFFYRGVALGTSKRDDLIGQRKVPVLWVALACRINKRCQLPRRLPKTTSTACKSSYRLGNTLGTAPSTSTSTSTNSQLCRTMGVWGLAPKKKKIYNLWFYPL